MRRLTIVAVLVIGIAAGCTKYVEQITPPGRVAPLTRVQPARPYHYEPLPRNANAVSSEKRTAREPAPKMESFFNPSIIEVFSKVYKKAGSPRLAIFLNRSLCDEVREWDTVSRDVVSIYAEGTAHIGTTARSFQGGGALSAYHQRQIPSPERHSPGELWMWRFEECFLQPFLDVGVKIVDRALIMRLTAASEVRQGGAYGPAPVKKIEMDALMGRADLLIEILIKNTSNAQLGYEFKATAKEVPTGIIRANVTSMDWSYDREPTEEVIATASGYRIVKDNGSSKLPPVNVVSRDLALALMQSLVNSWQK